MNKNQRGFAHLEILLVLLIVGIVSGVGWYVWQNKNSSKSVNNTSVAVNNTSSPKIESYSDCVKSDVTTKDTKAFPNTCTTKAGKKFEDPEPHADWKKYESNDGKYSLRYPTSWAKDTCDSQGTDVTLYLGPTEASRVKCNSEHLSQIMFVSTTSVPTESEQKMDPEYYKDIESQEVTVDGVKGKRQSGKLKAELMTMPVNTLVVQYIFLVPGRSYLAAYMQTPSGDYTQDNLVYFDSMVKNTLVFTE